jgi:NADPH:quinone reductase-like Zn-dependent oxidoreductase
MSSIDEVAVPQVMVDRSRINTMTSNQIGDAEPAGGVLPGWEFTGDVEIGSSVRGFKTGDRVFGTGDVLPIKTLIADSSRLFPGLESWPQRLQIWSQSNAMINRVVLISACIEIIGTRNQLERLAMRGVLLQ